MSSVYQKKFVTALVSCAVVLTLVTGEASAALADDIIKKAPKDTPKVDGLVLDANDRLPSVTARSAVVLEARTGRVLYERNMDERRFPASTTKIMTLIVALENGNLDDVVRVGKHAAGTEGSTLWLEEGDEITLRELLYGMMMHSGNDATVAIAEHIAGSVDRFARLMTDKAHELGARDTNFVNANGLPDDAHYTTAHDMALIAAYGYSLPEFEDIVSTKEITFPWVKDDTHRLRNENQMLWLYEGGNGVKTGYTDAAGRCLVAGAKRDGIQLVSVVLDSNWMWNDSILLLDYGFAHIDRTTVVREGTQVGTVAVTGGRTRRIGVQAKETVVLPAIDGAAGYEQQVDLPRDIKAPVKKGDVVGTLRVLYEGREVATTDLVAMQGAERKSFFLTLWKNVSALLGIRTGGK
ncbi:MAG: D-alanyl-D-alanine carboxypeptidase [Selenomonas sp.]|uniref:D-alanyl-D-alanine carboxypeptidase family protein n=1 Tax=Selenomonas sp. TaxID=2053611 RepID=UPI0025EDFA11|nr:D-alanyl-D-alanine carboxypeptidase family protein [Selenomonas sp.]MCI6085125.1 D-alanyl-D-alanine carboxypeptidase [Selenomonas sp.]MDY4416363.1 D-alanyl-D-alanine carboxypeptidase family protein [Selenomonas sp.]